MKITRRQLRQIINEAVLQEAEFESQGPGSWIRGAGAGLGAAGGFFAGYGVGAGIGLGLGVKASNFVANKLGYLSGDIPDDHPLQPENLYLEYGLIFNNKEELLNYLESIEKGKFKAMYHVEDFEAIGSDVAAETLRLLGEAGRVLQGLDAAISTANSMKSAGLTKGFGLTDKKVQSRFGKAKDTLMGFFGGEDDDEETAIASNEEEDDFPERDMFGDPINQKKT